ncbi:hypothetical protein CsSME_00025497 [Camellia sinensis var. sinensis]
MRPKRERSVNLASEKESNQSKRSTDEDKRLFAIAIRPRQECRDFRPLVREPSQLQTREPKRVQHSKD